MSVPAFLTGARRTGGLVALRACLAEELTHTPALLCSVRTETALECGMPRSARPDRLVLLALRAPPRPQQPPRPVHAPAPPIRLIPSTCSFKQGA